MQIYDFYFVLDTIIRKCPQ